MSMVGADMLFRIHRRMQEVFKNRDLFGGVGVVLVGDLLQIPPVQEKQIFAEPNNKDAKIFHDATPLWEQFDVIVFNHNHRQGDGNAYSDLLNRVRIGEPSDDDLALLMKCELQEEDVSFDTCHIMYLNDEKNAQNKKLLDRLDTELVTMECIERPHWYKSKTKHGCVGNTQFMRILELKVGARVALIHNINTYDDLYNNAMGTVEGFEGEGKVEIIMVKFDNESSGQNQRIKYSEYCQKPAYKDCNVTPIPRYDNKYPIPPFHEKTAHVIQFPLQLAWASTAHRIQVRKL